MEDSGWPQSDGGELIYWVQQFDQSLSLSLRGRFNLVAAGLEQTVLVVLWALWTGPKWETARRFVWNRVAKSLRYTAESTKQAPRCIDLANLAGSLSRRNRRLHILYCVLFLIRRGNYQVTNIRTRLPHPGHASLWALGWWSVCKACSNYFLRQLKDGFHDPMLCSPTVMPASMGWLWAINRAPKERFKGKIHLLT